jgi:hypothetical protein
LITGIPFPRFPSSGAISLSPKGTRNELVESPD